MEHPAREVRPTRSTVLRELCYRAASWGRSRRVAAKVERHSGELYARVGFLVTNLLSSAERVVTFYNGPGTAEQWIKAAKSVKKWTRDLFRRVLEMIDGLRPRRVALW